jgi:hypothetical protein
MAALILRVRDLINDTLPLGSGQVWTDDQIQDVMDESREDLVNFSLIPKPTYLGSSIQYLNYYSNYGGFEDDYILKQYLTLTVTPSAVEPIAGHFQFAANVFPPVYIAQGKRHDVYRSAADLLERWAAKVVLEYDVVVGGQTFRRSQASDALIKLAKQYRAKQRPRSLSMTRSDLAGSGEVEALTLQAGELDYMASGNGSG